MARMTRRGILGRGVTAAAVAGLAGAASGQPPVLEGADAELIAIGQEAADLIKKRRPLEVRWWALPQDSGSRRKGTPENVELHAVADALEPIDSRLNDLADRAIELRATTREAWIAKARLIRREMQIEFVTDGAIEVDELQPASRLTWSLLNDLLGEAA